MTIKALKCTAIGIILALFLTAIFNVSYWITLFVLGDKQYALNMALVSSLIILIGTFIDIFKSIHIEKETTELPSKTIKVATTVEPDDIKSEVDPNKHKDVLNNIQEGIELGQSGVRQFTDAEADSAETKLFNNLIE